jgi:hypothetical protein
MEADIAKSAHVFASLVCLAILLPWTQAGALEQLNEGLELTEVERDSNWIKVTYKYQNLSDKRIGIGAVRCLLYTERGELVSSASDRITSADVSHGTQYGVVLLALKGHDVVRYRCRVEVSFWMVDGSYVEAANRIVPPAKVESSTGPR